MSDEDALDNLESFINYFSREWPEIATTNFNPLNVSLPLMDSSTVGLAHKYPEFLKLRDEFSNSLRQAVNQHYEAFNASIGSYGITVQTITDSKDTLKNIRINLENANTLLSTPTVVLRDLNSKSIEHSQMIEVLDKIVEVRKLTEVIDNYITDKDFKKAQELIVQSAKTADEYGLWQLPAMTSTQMYLSVQSQALFDSVMEEAFSIIYLKLDNEMNKSIFEQHTDKKLDYSDLEEASRIVNKPLDEFISELKGNIDGVSPGVDIQSFKMLATYFEVLNKLDRLPDAMTALIERCSGELEQMISRTSEEIRLKYPEQMKLTSTNVSTSSSSIKKYDSHRLLDIGGISSILGGVNSVILSEFFHSLFHKFIITLQCFRAIYEFNSELINKTSEIPDSNQSSNLYGLNSLDRESKTKSAILGGLRGVNAGGLNSSRIVSTHQDSVPTFISLWKKVEKEISSIIYYYIVDEMINIEKPVKDNDDNPFIESKLGGNATLVTHEDAIFRFSKLTFKSDNFRELNETFQNFFPVEQVDKNNNKYNGNGNKNNQDKNNKVNESLFIESNDHSKNSTLVDPNILNMGVIFGDFIFFIGCCDSIYPTELIVRASSDNGANSQPTTVDKIEVSPDKLISPPIEFFDNFMRIVFLSQLETTLKLQFDEVNLDSVNNIGGTSFKIFFESICEILTTSLYFREPYVKILLKLMKQMINKFEKKFDSLMPKEYLNLTDSKIISNWMNNEELVSISSKIINGDVNSKADVANLLNQEVELLLKPNARTDQLINKILPSDLMDTNRFNNLVMLLSNILKILEWLPNMQRVINESGRKSLPSISSIVMQSSIKNDERDNEENLSANSSFMTPSSPGFATGGNATKLLELKETWNIIDNKSITSSISSLLTYDEDEDINNNHYHTTYSKGSNKFLEFEDIFKSGNENGDNLEKDSDNYYRSNDGGNRLYSNKQVKPKAFITMTLQYSKEFNQYLNDLKKISNQIKLLLRYDLKIKCIYYIINFLKQDIWTPDYETEDIDEIIIKLTKSINDSNLIIDFNLYSKVKFDILSGVPILIDKLMIKESHRIYKMNEYGLIKILLNIRVIQQMLRNVINYKLDSSDINFGKSIEYFELFKTGENNIADRIIQQINSGNKGSVYTLEEYKNLMRLVFSENLSKPIANGKKTTSLSYNMKFDESIKKVVTEFNK
ncbi:hypothetical protein BVG19_g242 [[Candida] boidinii]|nr:hypothetical protein BVG19_g242 [[Candida] boidinii]OWB49773.1 hypothetical protein B5S27_g1317 [[Candida] boidinii]